MPTIPDIKMWVKIVCKYNTPHLKIKRLYFTTMLCMASVIKKKKKRRVWPVMNLLNRRIVFQ
jgi:hypothetical protein